MKLFDRETSSPFETILRILVKRKLEFTKNTKKMQVQIENLFRTILE